jgi:hypothetical protein
MSERFDHPLHRVVRFEPSHAYELRVYFDDGTVQRIDFEPVLEGELFGPLRDPTVFRGVRLDPGAGTLVWPNGADFDPATLHDWPDHADEFAALARRWRERAGA